MTDNTTIITNLTTILNDPQNTVETVKDHSDQKEIPTTVKDNNNGTHIHNDQSYRSNGTINKHINETSPQLNTNDQSSNFDGTTTDKDGQLNTNNQSSESPGATNYEKNIQLNANDPLVVRNESRTENENKSNAADTSVQSVPHSHDPSSIIEDDNHTRNTITHLLSVKTETSPTDKHEQHIDNNSNEQSLVQVKEQTSGSISPTQQQKENSKPVLLDEINISFKENNAEQDGDTHNNQFYKQIETEKNNEQTKKLNLPALDPVNHQNGETDLNTKVQMDITPSPAISQFADLESGYAADQSLVPLQSLSNNQTANKAELYKVTSNDEVSDSSEQNPKPSDSPINTPEESPGSVTIEETRAPATLTEFEFNNSPDKLPADKLWLNLQYHDENHEHIKKPNEIEKQMNEPTVTIDDNILNRIQGSMIGMALGDALGAHVEFRPRQYLVANPVEDLGSGGTWGLEKGQFTDDTSMALCLANSLVACADFVPYDQLVRYRWWYESGYMSSTGQCFDIGAATRQSVAEFERRQRNFADKYNINFKDMDYLSDPKAFKEFNVYCSEDGVAGNGALMRLAPVPLFFYRDPAKAVEFSGDSGKITHGDTKAYDACRYYGALIVAALRGYEKEELLNKEFYLKHKDWFGKNELHPDIKSIAEGSYRKKQGYDDGIRGKGYIVNALEAALWAFWSDENSFEKGALAAVNLGDDTDTTAAIYGQLAGAHYGYRKLPEHWVKHVYARKFLEKLSKWIAYEGECWQNSHTSFVSQL